MATNYTPHPGELDRLIDIVHVVNDLNENGYPVARDDVVCRQIWAGVKDASSSYGHAADTDISTVGLRFHIRWRDDVKVGMTVLYEDERHEIVQIGTVGFNRAYLELFTKKVEGVR